MHGRSPLLTLLFVAAISAPRYLAADGLPSEQPAAPPPIPAAAEPTRDPRLPPLLPGESVSQGNGRRMKVWTSAGPVESQLTIQARQPQPFTGNGSGNPPIILDTRRQQVPQETAPLREQPLREPPLRDPGTVGRSTVIEEPRGRAADDSLDRQGLDFGNEPPGTERLGDLRAPHADGESLD